MRRFSLRWSHGPQSIFYLSATLYCEWRCERPSDLDTALGSGRTRRVPPIAASEFNWLSLPVAANNC